MYKEIMRDLSGSGTECWVLAVKLKDSNSFVFYNGTLMSIYDKNPNFYLVFNGPNGRQMKSGAKKFDSTNLVKSNVNRLIKSFPVHVFKDLVPITTVTEKKTLSHIEDFRLKHGMKGRPLVYKYNVVDVLNKIYGEDSVYLIQLLSDAQEAVKGEEFFKTSVVSITTDENLIDWI